MIVNVKVVEGDRTRVQAYEGVCIGRSGGGLNESFTVRKISYGEGVERVFPVMSPMIDSIKVVRRGKVRRAKLYYLRDLRGKSARIVEKKQDRAGCCRQRVSSAYRRVFESAGPNPALFCCVSRATSKPLVDFPVTACAIYSWNVSRSDQPLARQAHRHRRSLAAARPVLRTLRDLGNVRAYARSLKAALTILLPRAPAAHTRSTQHSLELTLMSKPTTLYDKIWNDHLVHEAEDGTCLLYIDRHLVHEVTSPQAFEGLRATGRKVHAPEKTLAVVDHNVPTTDRTKPNPDPESIEQIKALAENAKEFGIEYYDEFDKRQGIVHVIGPEQGFTLPGTTIVCGDSHTSTHGAFGALAHGIGTSEVEHVLATQTLIQKKAKNMRVTVDGKLPDGVTGKDIILAIIGEIGTAGGTGYVLEYAGDAIRALSMEGRMTVCNMSIEGGARAGLVAPDQKAFDFLRGRPKAPKGADWDAAMRYWDKLRSDEGAHFDHELRLDAAKLPPIVTWGT